MRRTVATLLDAKAPGVWSVGPGASVYEALELMSERNVGALLVVDEGSLVGIMSERDYARKVILLDRGSRDTTVAEIMSHDPVSVSADATTAECMQIMTDNRFRHLPVVDESGGVVGVISIGDVVRAVIDEQQFLIDQLEGYITS